MHVDFLTLFFAYHVIWNILQFNIWWCLLGTRDVITLTALVALLSRRWHCSSLHLTEKPSWIVVKSPLRSWTKSWSPPLSGEAPRMETACHVTRAKLDQVVYASRLSAEGGSGRRRPSGVVGPSCEVPLSLAKLQGWKQLVTSLGRSWTKSSTPLVSLLTARPSGVDEASLLKHQSLWRNWTKSAKSLVSLLKPQSLWPGSKDGTARDVSLLKLDQVGEVPFSLPGLQSSRTFYIPHTVVSINPITILLTPVIRWSIFSNNSHTRRPPMQTTQHQNRVSLRVPVILNSYGFTKEPY